MINTYILDELRKKSKNVYASWKIKIPRFGKLLLDAYIKPFDGITKYEEKCILNFNDKGDRCDSGVATAERQTPPWVLDCLLNQGKVLKFIHNGIEYRYGRIRIRTLNDKLKHLEISGKWMSKVLNDWKPVEYHK